MNQAHAESLELLEIVHTICKSQDIQYTLADNTLISYVNGINFEESIPMIQIALLYPAFIKLKKALKEFCAIHSEEYSLHDYSNTKQFYSLDMWFVKMAKIQFSSSREEDSFYYGTRLIITPLLFAGNTEKEWKNAYQYYKTAMSTVNARAVLRGKPFLSYIKLSKKRITSNYYIKKRGKYSIEKILERYGTYKKTKYILYTHMVGRNPKNPNSLTRVVLQESMHVTYNIWNDIKEIDFYGKKCYVVTNPQKIMECFPSYLISEVLKKNKSQLLLNGNTYLWRVQQIQIELLTEFDRICRKHNLKYNISFGTLLGAVRHKGFIPWDDDIDVTMPWEDYNKLDGIMKKELDDTKYYFRTPENEPNNHLIFKHLERKGTIYTKPGRNKLKQQIGVFIDIFPMYPSAPNMLVDWVHAKVCRYWRTALWATVGAESEQSERKRKRYQRMARHGNVYCYQKFVRAATYFRKEKKYLKFWIAMDRNPYKVPLVEMQNYTDVIELEFEGRKFLAPRNYKAVLDYCFGVDWQLYPTVGGRVPAHNAIMDIGDLYQKESEGN